MGYLDQRVAHLLALVLELAQLLASSPRRTATSGVRTYELRARATLGYREKRMSSGKVYVSHVYYRIYIMITKSLSRWHHSRSSAWLGSISNASTTKRRSSADGIHTIAISVDKAKTQELRLMQQRTTSHVEPLRT